MLCPAHYSLEEVGLIRRLLPGCESDGFDLSDSDTSVEVITGVPLGLGVSSERLNRCLLFKDYLDGLDLPVGVLLCGNDSVLVEVVLIHDGLVLVTVLAWLDVDLDLGHELLNGALNCFPVLLLDGGNEGIA